MARLTYYMDETGNRRPDKKPHNPQQGRDWFALGGFLLWDNDKEALKSAHRAFCSKWNVRSPLHITDMLATRKGFSWLARLTDRESTRFWEEYKDFLADIPALGTACVISRSGYVKRGYLEKHKDPKWFLCRSAFDITVERAVKYAISKRVKLDIVFESDAPFNPIMKGYFDNLKTNGLGFDTNNSSKYAPLPQQAFAETLGRIEYRDKSNVFMQIADSYVYAIARQKYDRNFHIYRRLRDNNRIINFSLGDAERIRAMGIKHYCFD